jgi:hypothetical protein
MVTEIVEAQTRRGAFQLTNVRLAFLILALGRRILQCVALWQVTALVILRHAVRQPAIGSSDSAYSHP